MLALAVPVLGFGARPTLRRAALYAAPADRRERGRRARPRAGDVRDAADGMGMSPCGCSRDVELPLAAPVILAGIRVSVTIGIGTATIGSTVGALTLGTPIIDGLPARTRPMCCRARSLVALLAISSIASSRTWCDWARRRSGTLTSGARAVG